MNMVGNTTHGLRHATKGAHKTAHESMQVTTPRRCNDRCMILGSKNQMVMQAELGFSSAPAGAKRLMYRIPVGCTSG
jgi:hypothetical protein